MVREHMVHFTPDIEVSHKLPGHEGCKPCGFFVKMHLQSCISTSIPDASVDPNAQHD